MVKREVTTCPPQNILGQPVERGASSTFFKRLEEAGCVARESALGLDKMLNLVTFGPGN
jgi:hypothetical protein